MTHRVDTPLRVVKQKPEIVNSRVVATTRLFRVEAVDLRFSNGVEARFERLMGTGRGAVLVIPLFEREQMVLVRE
ncbi:MAG: hypothetical protein GWO05_05580, partial [Gammaproteobacteria bacterium]|nr:hypothetical protein [Gammaproteobacteria bacterium]